MTTVNDLVIKTRVRFVDVEDVFETRRAVFEVTPEQAVLELPRGERGPAGTKIIGVELADGFLEVTGQDGASARVIGRVPIGAELEAKVRSLESRVGAGAADLSVTISNGVVSVVEAVAAGRGELQSVAARARDDVTSAAASATRSVERTAASATDAVAASAEFAIGRVTEKIGAATAVAGRVEAAVSEIEAFQSDWELVKSAGGEAAAAAASSGEAGEAADRASAAAVEAQGYAAQTITDRAVVVEAAGRVETLASGVDVKHGEVSVAVGQIIEFESKWPLVQQAGTYAEQAQVSAEAAAASEGRVGEIVSNAAEEVRAEVGEAPVRAEAARDRAEQARDRAEAAAGEAESKGALAGERAAMAEVSRLTDGAPEELDTLREIADEIQAGNEMSAALTQNLTSKLPKSDVSVAADGGVVVRRKADGHVTVPSVPVADDDATSKRWVEQCIVDGVASVDVSEQLEGKADKSHMHVAGDVTGLTAALGELAQKDHTHTVADVTGLDGQLAGRTHFVDTIPTNAEPGWRVGDVLELPDGARHKITEI